MPLAHPEQAAIVELAPDLQRPRGAARSTARRRRTSPRHKKELAGGPGPGPVHRDDRWRGADHARRRSRDTCWTAWSRREAGPAPRPRPTAQPSGSRSRPTCDEMVKAHQAEGVDPNARADPVPRHHRVSGDRAGRRSVRRLRPPARHHAIRRSRSASTRWPTPTSPTGIRRRSTTTAPRSSSPMNGAAAASRSAASPTSRSGARMQSSR